MRKLIGLFIVLCLMMSCLVACQPSEESLESRVNELQKEVLELEKQRDSIKNEIEGKKVETGNAKYVITFNIKQSHYTLDISQHLKDSMNDISIQIPVDKEYYDSVNEGDVIDDSFRMGSLVFKGSWGKWKVTVEKKEII